MYIPNIMLLFMCDNQGKTKLIILFNDKYPSANKLSLLVVLSSRLRGQSRRTENYTEERTQSAETSVTQGLDQRLSSTLELRTHLHTAINNTVDELALQNTMKCRLQVRSCSPALTGYNK